MEVRMWYFEVKDGHEKDFEGMNEHDWPELFRRSTGYLWTRYGKSLDDNRGYYTVDGWKTRNDFEEFKSANENDFNEMDEKHKEYYDLADDLGWYELELPRTPGH